MLTIISLRALCLTAILSCVCTYTLAGQVNPETSSKRAESIEIKKQSLPVKVEVSGLKGLNDYLAENEQIATITATGENDRTTRIGLRLSETQTNQSVDLQQSPVLGTLSEVDRPGNKLYVELKLAGGEIITDESADKKWIVSSGSSKEAITASVIKKGSVPTVAGTYHLAVDGVEWSE